MKILIVSFFFPPRNLIGAVRMGKLAKFLYGRGHDVRVLTVRAGRSDNSLPIEIPEHLICRTAWLDVNALPARISRGWRDRWQTDAGEPQPNMRCTNLSMRVRSRPLLGRVWRSTLNIPDDKIGWWPFAMARVRALVRRWRPDVIYASYSPFTSFLVASHLASAIQRPWTAEFRDLWVDHDNYSLPGWRRRLDARLERRVVRTASRVVAVNESSASVLRRKFALPTLVVMNGFDPDDYRYAGQIMDPDRSVLKLVYTGTVYRFHDPSPLLEALRLMGAGGQRVHVNFLGPFPEHIFRTAHEYGMADRLEWAGKMSFHDTVAHQMRADILLLLLWRGPGQRTHFHAKMFEYFGARRPILGIGDPSDPVASLIHARGAGLVSADPAIIRDQLEQWLAAKQKGSGIPPLDDEARRGLSREDQFALLEGALEDLVRNQQRSLD